MKISLLKIWNSIKLNLDVYLFFLFLIVCTLSIRKIIFQFPINNQFNEYTSIYIYLSDVALIIVVLFWLIILYNKYSYVSNIATSILSTRSIIGNMFHVEQYNLLKRRNFLLLAPLVIIIISIISVFWSGNVTLSFYKSVRLIEFYLLYLFIIYRIVPRETFIINSLLVLIFVGLVNSIIGIAQFIINKSIGLGFLGESILSPEIAGVAKIEISSTVFIRAYGLFPHPNIFAGFLLISIISSIYIILRIGNKDLRPSKSIVPRGTMYHIISILTQLIALLFTFSKSAILGLFIVITILLFKRFINVPRGTFFTTKLRNTQILLLICMTLVLSLIFFNDIQSNIRKSLNERLLYQDIAINIITAHPFLGLGSGQFVIQMQKHSQLNLEKWQFQPVHNVFLLIFSELGIFAFILLIIIFLLIILFLLNVPCGTKLSRFELVPLIILLSLIPASMLDHYLYDIQQGQIILWMILGMCVAVIRKSNSVSI